MATEEKTESASEKKFEKVPETGGEEPHRVGLKTKIKERLDSARQEASKEAHQASSGAVGFVKHKIDEVKLEHRKVSDRKKYLHQVETNARREAEIEQAKASGQRAAKKEYGFLPQQTSSKGSKSSGRSGGASGILGFGLFGQSQGSGSFGGGYYDLFGGGSAPKKPKPVRTTVVNPRTGKVTITETGIEGQYESKHGKPSFKQKDRAWSPDDLISGPELHTRGIPNPLDLNLAHKPTIDPGHKGKGHKKSKRGHSKQRNKTWNIGDLV